MNSTSSLNENFTSTLNTTSNDFTNAILTYPFYYGSSIIFIFLLLCILSIIIFIKIRPKLLFSTHI